MTTVLGARDDAFVSFAHSGPMRDAAPFGSLSASVPASAPASPSHSRRSPGNGGFETHRAGESREERFERKVDRVLSLVDALDARLAALAGSVSEETGGEAIERAAGVRGYLDRLLRSPPWSERTEKTPRPESASTVE